MRRFLIFPILFILVCVFCFNFSAPVLAADIRAGEDISIGSGEKNLSDLFLFGKNISVGAPVNNDVVAGGEDVLIENSVGGNVIAGAGSIKIKGMIGSVKVAGGSVVIDGDVERDVVAAGGSVVISRSSNIAGDLIIAGGDLTVDGSVGGRVFVNGGKAKINGRINGKVQANIEKLSVGSMAVIGGDLDYHSGQKAMIASGAKIMGTERFRYAPQTKKVSSAAVGLLTGFTVYKLATDLIVTVGLIFFLGVFLKLCFARSEKSPLSSGVYGFAFLLLAPAAAMILLLLFWLGVGVMVFYILFILLAVYITKAFLGWAILKWWYKRDKKIYSLDWRAGVVGPIVLFAIGFIPFLGWLVWMVVYLVSLGSLLIEVFTVLRAQSLNYKKK